MLATVSRLARHLREDSLTGKAGMWCWARAVRPGYWWRGYWRWSSHSSSLCSTHPTPVAHQGGQWATGRQGRGGEAFQAGGTEATKHVRGWSQHTSSRRRCKFRQLWDGAQKRIAWCGQITGGPGCGGEGLPLDSVIVSWQLLKVDRRIQLASLQGRGDSASISSWFSWRKGQVLLPQAQWEIPLFPSPAVPGLGAMVCWCNSYVPVRGVLTWAGAGGWCSAHGSLSMCPQLLNAAVPLGHQGQCRKKL